VTIACIARTETRTEPQDTNDLQIVASQCIPVKLRSDCLYLDNGDKKKYYWTEWNHFFCGIIVVNCFTGFFLLLLESPKIKEINEL
jgi:hypothetical protein